MITQLQGMFGAFLLTTFSSQITFYVNKIVKGVQDVERVGKVQIHIQCLKKLIKCLVLLHSFNDISTTRPYYVMYLILFESP